MKRRKTLTALVRAVEDRLSRDGGRYRAHEQIRDRFSRLAIHQRFIAGHSIESIAKMQPTFFGLDVERELRSVFNELDDPSYRPRFTL
jgi:hypothetical protein